MRLEVAFTPALLAEPAGKVCVVVDLLRASSSLVTMFARGLGEALVAGTVEEARALAAARPGYLLCGEQGGLPPAGFDYGNSPSDFARLDLAGRRAVLVTTNGTPALGRAAECAIALVGALANVGAAADAAVRQATDAGLEIVVLCAGEGGGRFLSIEDAFCAGALVEAVVSAAGRRVQLWGSASVARRLYRSYGRSALAAFRESDHGAGLIALGFERDLRFCARKDRYDVVPRVTRRRDGTLAVRRA